MTLLQSIILGIVQGATEFIPVSSSGHLVIVPYLFNWHIPPRDAFIFDVLLQVATLAAVFAYFWKDIFEILGGFVAGLIQKRPFETFQSKIGWYLILATIPAGLAGLILKPYVENAFQSPLAVAIFLVITAIFLFLAERVGQRSRPIEAINWLDALCMGVFQIAAVFPGISRSGSTISGGMVRNLNRPAAARFSFLMSIPIILAAGLMAAADLLAMPSLQGNWGILLIGFLSAALSGYFSIHWLLRYLSRQPLYLFAIYCLVAAAVTIAVTLLRG